MKTCSNQTCGREWREGFRSGIPIFLGYLSVAFGVGILADQAGLSVWQALVLSLTNLTSAGEVAGIGIIRAGGSLIEMVMTQLVINLRYALMAIPLTQRTDSSFRTRQRLLVSYGITDEIFAVAFSREKRISPTFMYGLILISAAGWVLGTFLGASAGQLLPVSLTNSLGIMLYAMFIAICLPAAKKDRHLWPVLLLALVISCLIRFLLPSVTGGFAIIISALLSALAGAILFPLPPDDSSDEDE